MPQKPKVTKSEKKRRKPTKRSRTDTPFIGRLKGQFQIVGDITAPLDPPEVWTGDLENIDGKPEPQS